MAEGRSPEAPNPTRVLVVDDSTVIRQAIRKMLQNDFDIVLAEDGEAGWNKLCEDPTIRVLITDIEMPRLDGYGFICRARAADVNYIRDLPIIAITGAEDEDTKARAYACGATDFITKPLDKLQLQARVHAYAQFDETARSLTEKTEVLEEEAINDPVTQLRSRRYFVQRGAQDLSLAIRHQEPLSVIRLDIDRFKKIYQQFGDDAVDHILVRLANILAGAARTEDTVARVGGAEFALLAPRTDRTAGVALGERLRAAVAAERMQYNGTAIPLTVSMGLATLGADHRNSIEDLLKLAEQRLHHAQSDGGDRVSVSVFGEAMEPEEVTLTAPEPLPNMEPLPEMEPAEPLTDEFDEIRFEAPSLPVSSAPTAVRPRGTQTPLLFDLISIDRAVQLLARGDGPALEPYLPALVAQIVPLLEWYARNASGETKACIEALKARLTSP